MNRNILLQRRAQMRVMPAKAGIHSGVCCNVRQKWIPTFAGMTWRQFRKYNNGY